MNGAGHRSVHGRRRADGVPGNHQIQESSHILACQAEYGIVCPV